MKEEHFIGDQKMEVFRSQNLQRKRGVGDVGGGLRVLPHGVRP